MGMGGRWRHLCFHALIPWLPLCRVWSARALSAAHMGMPLCSRGPGPEVNAVGVGGKGDVAGQSNLPTVAQRIHGFIGLHHLDLDNNLFVGSFKKILLRLLLLLNDKI